MAAHTDVETTKTVSAETVCATLEQNSFRSETMDDFLYYGLEDADETFVIHALIEREVDGMVLSLFETHVVDVAGAREVVFEFVERTGHHSIGSVKGLLHSISVVDVDVDVQNSLVVIQHLKNRQYHIIHVAEPARLRLFSMVQSSTPIYHGFEVSFVKQIRTHHRSTAV